MITPQQRDHFDKFGYVVVGPLIDGAQVMALRNAFAERVAVWAQQVGTSVNEYLEVVSQWTNVWEDNPVFRAQLHHRRAAGIAAELLECDRVRVFHDHLIVKPPHGGSTIPWHRDLPNWPIREPRAVSCWLSMDEASADSGALRFMPGTYREPITPSIDFLNESKEWGARESEAVVVQVQPGHALFHHCLGWHMSPPNNSATWRRAYITIYLDATCTFDPTRSSWHPMTSRVSVAPGEVFNDDVFPILGGRKSAT